jgi:hypothetical protein
MPQLVGSSCVRCSKRIESILEGKFCAECDSPVHNPCAQPDNDGGPLRCSHCGAERTEEEIKQAEVSVRGSRKPDGKQRPISLTVIGALLMIGAIGGLIGSTVTLDDPRVQQQLEHGPFPKSIQLGFFYGSLSVLLLSGIGILVDDFASARKPDFSYFLLFPVPTEGHTLFRACQESRATRIVVCWHVTAPSVEAMFHTEVLRCVVL